MHHFRINIICILIDIVIAICIKDAFKYTSFRDIYYMSNNLNNPNNYNNPNNHNNIINLK